MIQVYVSGGASRQSLIVHGQKMSKAVFAVYVVPYGIEVQKAANHSTQYVIVPDGVGLPSHTTMAKVNPKAKMMHVTPFLELLGVVGMKKATKKKVAKKKATKKKATKKKATKKGGASNQETEEEQPEEEPLDVESEEEVAPVRKGGAALKKKAASKKTKKSLETDETKNGGGHMDVSMLRKALKNTERFQHLSDASKYSEKLKEATRLLTRSYNTNKIDLEAREAEKSRAIKKDNEELVKVLEKGIIICKELMADAKVGLLWLRAAEADLKKGIFLTVPANVKRIPQLYSISEWINEYETIGDETRMIMDDVSGFYSNSGEDAVLHNYFKAENSEGQTTAKQIEMLQRAISLAEIENRQGGALKTRRGGASQAEEKAEAMEYLSPMYKHLLSAIFSPGFSDFSMNAMIEFMKNSGGMEQDGTLSRTLSISQRTRDKVLAQFWDSNEGDTQWV